jgi:hypothetical protein
MTAQQQAGQRMHKRSTFICYQLSLVYCVTEVALKREKMYGGVEVTTSVDKVEREQVWRKQINASRAENNCKYDGRQFSDTAKPVYDNHT